MGRLRPGHIVECALWLVAAAILYGLTFKFNQPIEIYRFGASAWPRALTLLIAVAALGQLYWNWAHGDTSGHTRLGVAETAEMKSVQVKPTKGWIITTAVLIALPFVYLRVPGWLEAAGLVAKGSVAAKFVVAGLVIACFAWLARLNRLGAMVALPVLFAALIEDFGFYFAAPLFIAAVMWLMGERRAGYLAAVTAVVYVILVFIFVKVLYVGLPTGNLRPFYDFGTWVVTILQ